MLDYKVNIIGLSCATVLKTVDIIFTAFFLSGSFRELNPLGFNWFSILLGFIPLFLFLLLTVFCKKDALVQKSLFIGFMSYIILGGIILGYHLRWVMFQ